MYSKPAMKYKYRGHRFDLGSSLLQSQEERFTNSMNNMRLATDKYNMQSVVPVKTTKNIDNTSLSAESDTPAGDSSLSQSNNTVGTLLEGASSFYAPYQMAQDAGSWFAKQAAEGKGPYANLYKKTVDAAMNPTVEGVTAKSAEEAAKEGTQVVGSNAGRLVGGLLTAAQFAKEVNDGYKNTVGTDPYSSTDAYNAIWGDGKTLGNVNVRFWNNIAGNYKDFVDSLNENVHFDSNAQGAVPLATDWKNARRIDWNEKDLHKGFGQHALDTIAGIGQGAMAGFTSGGVAGGILGGFVGLSEDITNKISAIRHRKDILDAKNKANQNIFNEAINRKINIMNDEKRRSEMRFASLGGKLFDQGGPMLTKFETGGSHEENPLGGIPQGIAPDGQPNLVEQGETKWDEEDYIFSKRLTINKRLAKEYNLPNDFIGKTFAYATEKFNEKFKEHENDAISLATQKAIFSRTREAQEALRADIEMKQLAEQMKNLTPEEQQTLLTQMEQQPMETQQMQYPNGASGMQQMQPMQEMPTMLQDPYGQGQAMVGAFGGQFNGGHKFSGEINTYAEFVEWLNKNNLTIDDYINQVYNNNGTLTGYEGNSLTGTTPRITADLIEKHWNDTGRFAHYKNTAKTFVSDKTGSSTADNSQDTKNTENNWNTIKANLSKRLVGQKTSNEPLPEDTYAKQFSQAVNEYWMDRMKKAKTQQDIEKIRDDYATYQDMYANLITLANETDDLQSPEFMEEVKKLQKAWREMGLDKYVDTPAEAAEKMNNIYKAKSVDANGNPIKSNSDATESGVYDGKLGVQTFARAFKVNDETQAFGKTIGLTWHNYRNDENDPGAPWFDTPEYNRNQIYLISNPKYQEAIEAGTPVDKLPAEYNTLDVPPGYTPEQAKVYLKTQGIDYDKEDLTDKVTDKYYFKQGKAPEKQAPADNPNLLPTWMRGVGAVLPFMFLNQKSDYSNADMIQAPKIGFTPIADYLKYRPLDKQYYLNSAIARQQNLRNNILNTSGGNRTAAANNLMLADLQAQDELGKLYELAERYNADQRQKVAAQNADVNKFNSQGFFNADQWNAQAEFQARQARAQMRHNIDTATAQANGANLTQGIQNLIGIGDENNRLNSINTNPAWAAMRGMDGQIMFKALQEYANNHPEEKTSACGGYLTIKNSKKRR